MPNKLSILLVGLCLIIHFFILCLHKFPKILTQQLPPGVLVLYDKSLILGIRIVVPGRYFSCIISLSLIIFWYAYMRPYCVKLTFFYKKFLYVISSWYDSNPSLQRESPANSPFSNFIYPTNLGDFTYFFSNTSSESNESPHDY